MIDRSAARYQQLYRHYADWYDAWARGRGIPVVDEQRREYALQRADAARAEELAASGSIPTVQSAPGDDVEIDTRERPERARFPLIDAPAPRPPRRGRMLAVAGVGAAACALLAIGAMVVPDLLGGVRAEAALGVRDIATEPVDAWRYEPTLPEHHTLWAEAMGDAVLVGTRADLAGLTSERGGAGEGATIAWYEGVEADYEAGWQAGSAYVEAYAEYERLVGRGEQPAFVAEDAFFPPEFDGIRPDDAAGRGHAPRPGAFEGWDDAVDGAWHGFSLPADMSDADALARLAAVDVETGEERWTADIGELLPGFELDEGWEARAADDERALVWSGSEIAVLDASDGARIASASLDAGVRDAVVVGSDLVVSLEDPDVVVGLPADDPGGERRWEAPVGDDADLVRLGADLVAARGSDGDLLIDAGAGEPLAWSAERGVRASRTLIPGEGEIAVADVAGRLVQAEVREDGGVVVSGVDARTGEIVWRSEETAAPVRLGDRLLTWGERGIASIDPETGAELWRAADVAGRIPVAIDEERLLVADQTSGAPRGGMVWLDPETGEVEEDAPAVELPEIAREVPLARGGDSVLLGESMIYGAAHGGGLLAYDPARREPLWRLSDDYLLAGREIVRILADDAGRVTGVARLGEG
ncbi:PQQ-binding-like beta-propeller repeat protein [Microbacterium sp. gxy059]|uniref:outer membrane protein assembly factor BamB family protein n=1 Tax=Microbacterium sp. gxy059 TaxID=2957199 RepID=UPI003D998A58